MAGAVTDRELGESVAPSTSAVCILCGFFILHWIRSVQCRVALDTVQNEKYYALRSWTFQTGGNLPSRLVARHED